MSEDPTQRAAGAPKAVMWAITDSYALVREAAVRALYRVDPARAPLTQKVAANYPEPKVRKVAQGLLKRR